MLVKIRFNQGYKVQAAGGPEYKAGEIVQVSYPSAKHFEARGVAEMVAERIEDEPVRKPGRPKKMDTEPDSLGE